MRKVWTGYALLLAAAAVLAGSALRAVEPVQGAAAERGATGMAGGQNRLTPDEQRAGWRLLFDGESLSGWRGYREEAPPAGWQVVDGELTRVGRGGDLLTSEQFADFELAFEWKVAEGGNSGVMYRVATNEEATYHTGPEYQVLDNARHRDGKDPLTSAGSCYGLYAPPKDVTRPVGDWNTARVVVRGNRVEHWLNEVKVVEYELLSPEWEKRVQASKFKQWPNYGRVARGHIAIQDHGDRVAYRNVRIKTPPT